MWWSCRAATSPARPGVSTPAPGACAWRSWPTPPSAWKPPNASSNSSNRKTESTCHEPTTATDHRSRLGKPRQHLAQGRAQGIRRRHRTCDFRAQQRQAACGHPRKAVLLSFRLRDNEIIKAGDLGFYDKVPTKFAHLTPEEMAATGVRVVPPAVARRGSYIAKGAILMPSYTNIGAYVDENTMVDTWATVGSCAQIGKNVHLSGGVGIGGVLEPVQAGPTIIEDNCFIGARSEIVEGVVVEENSVISMGVYIGQSTPIYNRATGETTYGRVPAGSVVISGSLPRDGGKYNLYAAIIVKTVDAQTRSKTSLNDLLRD
ncbi:unnamed protein product [Victoria cruziana]